MATRKATEHRLNGRGAARIGLAAPILAVALTCPIGALAQQAFPPPQIPKQLAATRAQNAIVVNGILNEADWSRAEVAGAFVQAEPQQGEFATEPTEVRVLYDDRYLYVGRLCGFDGRRRLARARSAAGFRRHHGRFLWRGR